MLTCIDAPTGRIDGTMPWAYQTQSDGQGYDDKCDFCGRPRAVCPVWTLPGGERGRLMQSTITGKAICRDCMMAAHQMVGAYMTRGAA